ncbi:MAG: MFS transporter [Pseudomonadota bacterium]
MAILTRYLERHTSFTKNWLPWIVSLSGGLLFFYEFLQINMLNSLSNSLESTFNVDVAQIGELFFIYSTTNGLLLFPAGNLLDRFSTRKIVLISMILCITGTFGFALSKTFFMLKIFRFLVGVSGSFCFLSGAKLASRWFPSHKLGAVIGVIVTMGMLGGMTAQVPLSSLIHAYGWRQAIIIDGALGIFLFIIIFLLVKDRPRLDEFLKSQEKQDLELIGLWGAIWQLLSNRNNWFAACYTCFMNLPVFVLGAFLGSSYLQQIHHLTDKQAAFVSGMIYLGTIIGSPFFGYLSDKLKRRRLPMIVSSIIAIILIIPFILLNLSFVTYLWVFLAIGFITSSQVIGYPTASEHNPPIITGSAISIVSMVAILGGGYIVMSIGKLLSHTTHIVVSGVPHYTPKAYIHVMLSMPMFFILALIMACLLKETYCCQANTKL